MMSNKQLISKICRVARKRGLKPYRGYSGRSMFGKQCIGFYGEMGTCFAVAELIKRKTGHQYHYDNLGLDTICYFPRIEDER
jgi:hypothetical protein